MYHLLVTYIDPHGRRVTMETAYLTPAILARPNLTVATNAYVNRILFDTKHSVTPQAVGGEFSDATGNKFQAKTIDMFTEETVRGTLRPL